MDQENTTEDNAFEGLDAQTLLNYSQLTRKQLVEQMTADGLPNDNKNIEMLLHTLRDMDQTSVNRSKLDIDREIMSNDKRAQELVDRIYRNNPNVLEQGGGNGTPAGIEKLPSYEHDEGEKQQGVVDENYQSFLKRMDEQDSQ